jgi:dienelactone hydrolase
MDRGQIDPPPSIPPPSLHETPEQPMNTVRRSRREFLAASLAAGSLPALSAALPGWCAAADGAGREVPWLAEVHRPPEKPAADAPRLNPLLVDSAGRPITTLEGWRARRQELRKWWLEFLHPLEVSRDKVPALETVAEDRVDNVVRRLVRYEAEPGESTEAYLLMPAEGAGPRPGVVVLHSTVAYSIRQPAGVEGQPEKAFGLQLAKRGFVTFCPRNFLWPETVRISTADTVERFQRRHARSKGMAKMLFDAQVAVDILAARPEVDPKRLGTVGHSLGAKEVIYLAAFDDRIRVTVSSEGGVGTKFSNWDAAWYLGPDIREETFTHEQHELVALAAPHPFLLLGGDSADGARSWPFIAEALGVYRLHGATPRVGLFNHGKGHAVPPEAEARIYEWFETYL